MLVLQLCNLCCAAAVHLAPGVLLSTFPVWQLYILREWGETLPAAAWAAIRGEWWGSLAPPVQAGTPPHTSSIFIISSIISSIIKHRPA